MNDTDLETEILDYLTENPNAQDTLEGVTAWWISKEKMCAQKLKLSRF